MTDNRVKSEIHGFPVPKHCFNEMEYLATVPDWELRTSKLYRYFHCVLCGLIHREHVARSKMEVVEEAIQ